MEVGSALSREDECETQQDGPWVGKFIDPGHCAKAGDCQLHKQSSQSPITQSLGHSGQNCPLGEENESQFIMGVCRGMFFLLAKFGQILTGKIRFQPKQMIFHGKTIPNSQPPKKNQIARFLG